MHLEALAELHEICHALIHIALDERLALLSQALLLVLYKVAESRERVRRWLRALAVRSRRRRLARRRARARPSDRRAVRPVHRDLGHGGGLLFVAVRVRRAWDGVSRRRGNASREFLRGPRRGRGGWEAGATRAWRNVRVLPTDDGAVSTQITVSKRRERKDLRYLRDRWGNEKRTCLPRSCRCHQRCRALLQYARY